MLGAGRTPTLQAERASIMLCQVAAHAADHSLTGPFSKLLYDSLVPIRAGGQESKEQISQAIGLGAKILFWRSDLSPKVSGSVPGPARVVQHRPSECDKIGISRPEDRLGLLEIGDQANGNDRQRRRLFDCTRQGKLIAGSNRNLRRRTQSAA